MANEKIDIDEFEAWLEEADPELLQSLLGSPRQIDPESPTGTREELEKEEG